MKRVLILEDEIRIQDMLSAALQKRGYTPSKAYRVDEAWVLVGEYCFNLLIIDLNINGDKDAGMIFLRELNECGYHIPFLIVTGFTESFNGYDEHILRKPFSRKKFNEVISRYSVGD